MLNKRASGVLMHISSLPGTYGIGTMGEEAFRFIDFLRQAGQTYWQILPVCPTGHGNSPYQSFSSFAGNPLFIDPARLAADGYVTAEELAAATMSDNPTRVDYDAVTLAREALFNTIYPRFIANPPADFIPFCQDNAAWLEDYALFMAIHEATGLPLQQWEIALRTRRPQALAAWKVNSSARIQYHQMLQYFFYKQWTALKNYANQNGIYIIGDLPIYVAGDSADVWASPHLFELDENGCPTQVAGCPPDAFCEEGQLWGNPVYDWKTMRLSGYHWWLRRLAAGQRLYDVIRIDHFRGFSDYYTIPADATTARHGEWKDGPGMRLWNTVRRRLGDVPIIAEDLGFLTDKVRRLVHDSGFPGMKVLQFAFDPAGNSEYLPHHYPKNSVVYTGTHDNDTILGWAAALSDEERAFAQRYLHADDHNLRERMLCAALGSVANTCILTMQDLCALASEARMNTPSTVSRANWAWRLTADQLTPAIAVWLYENTRLYGRLSGH